MAVCILGSIDSDHFTTHIQKRTATVARIDGCICLDQSACLAIFSADIPVQGAYPAGSNRLAITKCITNSNNLLSYNKIIRTSELCDLDFLHRLFRNVGFLNCDHCKVILLICSFDLCRNCIFHICIPFRTCIFGKTAVTAACYSLCLFFCANHIASCKTYSKCSCTRYNMVVSSNQKLIIILTYNDSGAASFTLVLTCSISEKTRDLLNTDRCDSHNRRHSCLCNSCYCSALCHNIFNIGICGTAVCTFICSCKCFSFSDLCTAAVIIDAKLISRHIHTLENNTSYQPEDHRKGNCCSCFSAKSTVSFPTGCLKFPRFLRRNTSSCVIPCLWLMYLIMCISRRFRSVPAVSCSIRTACTVSLAFLHPPAC